jgi:hypothetical protein
MVFNLLDWQVEEKRTPLQLSMDELAKKLSMISFGIIGVICLIGVLQHRSWLDMFTIGGELQLCRMTSTVADIIDSISRGGGDPRGPANCNDRDARTRCPADGKAESNRQETAFSRGSRQCLRYLFRQDWYAHMFFAMAKLTVLLQVH